MTCGLPSGPTVAIRPSGWLFRYSTSASVNVPTRETVRLEARWKSTMLRAASTQTHWLRIADGKVIEHWANRDDLGMAVELGWVPPTPLYLLRSAVAKRRARRAAA